jgi:lipopolysaccharide transport system permease protein
VRHVKVKYKQAAVGLGWAIIQPVLSAGLFAVFLGQVAHIGSEGAPYFLFALAGMVVWTYFSTSTGGAMESLIADQAMLRKVYFPREILPMAAVIAALVDLVPAIGVLLIASVAFGSIPTLWWLLLPIPLLIVVTTATALGLFLAAINVYYRDVRYALPFVLQLGLFASPVIYSLSRVPSRWRQSYTVLNPVAASIDGVRRIVLHREPLDWTVTLAALGWSILLLIGGYAVFKRLERSFSDRV